MANAKETVSHSSEEEGKGKMRTLYFLHKHFAGKHGSAVTFMAQHAGACCLYACASFGAGWTAHAILINHLDVTID